MALQLTPATAINAFSAVLLIGLAVFVAVVGPRRRANLAFAAFSAALGYRWVVRNLVADTDPAFASLFVTTMIATVVAFIALVVVAVEFPRPLAPRSWRNLFAASVGAGGYFAAAWVSYALYTEETLANAVGPAFRAQHGAVAFWDYLLFAVLFAALLGFLVLQPLRYHEAAGAAHTLQRRQHALVAAAVTLYVGILNGGSLLAPDRPSVNAAFAGTAVLVLVALLWARSTWGRDDADSRTPRNMAILTMGVPVLGILLVASQGDFYGFQPQYGIARTLAVVILGFGILRYQLLGMDVKVKITIRRGAFAGIFVAVFFVVSQIAQNLLNDTLGWALGGIAAGLLLFLSSPLLRLAGGIADAVIPDAKPVAQMTHPERAALYRENAAFAWADGVLDRKERLLLNNLRDQLGISAAEAARLEEEAIKP